MTGMLAVHRVLRDVQRSDSPTILIQFTHGDPVRFAFFVVKSGLMVKK